MREISSDERALVTYVTHNGARSLVKKYQRARRWTWEFHSLRAPVLFKTKREAVTQLELYVAQLRSYDMARPRG